MLRIFLHEIVDVLFTHPLGRHAHVNGGVSASAGKAIIKAAVKQLSARVLPPTPLRIYATFDPATSVYVPC